MMGKTVLHYSHAPMPETAVSLAKTHLGVRGKLSFDEIASVNNLEDRYPEFKALPDNKSKRAFIAKLHGEMLAERSELKGKRKRLDDLNRIHVAIDDLFMWSQDSGIKIEKPDGPSFRKMRKAVAEGRTVYLGQEVGADAPALDFEKEVFRFAEILVIEHDWASAFKDADLADATVKLPYDVCAFEFKFSGRPVIALATQLDTEIAFTPAILCGDVWVLTDFVVPLSGFAPTDERNTGVIELLVEMADHIRAACIALDANVARAESVREPYSGVAGRNVHQPLKPYHVVSLARRAARPLASSSGTDTGRRVRLHFRRGHWRHFDEHKTWIKWMLVGDPDLGFVEKHYRL